MDVETRAYTAIVKAALSRGIQYPLLRIKAESRRGSRYFDINLDNDENVASDDVVESFDDFDIVMDVATHTIIGDADYSLEVINERLEIVKKEDLHEFYAKGKQQDR